MPENLDLSPVTSGTATNRGIFLRHVLSHIVRDPNHDPKTANIIKNTIGNISNQDPDKIPSETEGVKAHSILTSPSYLPYTQAAIKSAYPHMTHTPRGQGVKALGKPQYSGFAKNNLGFLFDTIKGVNGDLSALKSKIPYQVGSKERDALNRYFEGNNDTSGIRQRIHSSLIKRFGGNKDGVPATAAQKEQFKRNYGGKTGSSFTLSEDPSYDDIANTTIAQLGTQHQSALDTIHGIMNNPSHPFGHFRDTVAKLIDNNEPQELANFMTKLKAGTEQRHLPAKFYKEMDGATSDDNDDVSFGSTISDQNTADPQDLLTQEQTSPEEATKSTLPKIKSGDLMFHLAKTSIASDNHKHSFFDFIREPVRRHIYATSADEDEAHLQMQRLETFAKHPEMLSSSSLGEAFGKIKERYGKEEATAFKTGLALFGKHVLPSFSSAPKTIETLSEESPIGHLVNALGDIHGKLSEGTDHERKTAKLAQTIMSDAFSSQGLSPTRIKRLETLFHPKSPSHDLIQKYLVDQKMNISPEDFLEHIKTSVKGNMSRMGSGRESGAVRLRFGGLFRSLPKEMATQLLSNPAFYQSLEKHGNDSHEIHNHPNYTPDDYAAHSLHRIIDSHKFDLPSLNEEKEDKLHDILIPHARKNKTSIHGMLSHISEVSDIAQSNKRTPIKIKQLYLKFKSMGLDHEQTARAMKTLIES